MPEHDLEVPITPSGGVNLEQPSILIGDTQVQDSLNFLYENGTAITRPGLELKVQNIGHNSRYIRGYDLDGAVPYGISLSDDDKIYRYPTGIEITGAGVAFGSSQHHNSEVANGAILIGNNPGGIIRHVPLVGFAYTVIADAPYRYVTGHLSRAVGANRIEAGSEEPREVGWSVTGDETDWTGVGSGSVNLSDRSDDITGIRVIDNVLVILCRHGFVLGYPTGSSQPPFSFRNTVRRGSGCPYPSTVLEYDNAVYFVGYRDVYAFTLQDGAVPIGTNIRKLLLRHIAEGINYQALIQEGTTESDLVHYEPRYRYHLAPTNGGPGTPHFVYDLKEQTWSIHRYDISISAAFAFPLSGIAWTLGFAENEKVYEWVQDNTLEAGQEATLKSKTFMFPEASRDFKLNKLLLLWRMLKEGTSELSATVKVATTRNYKSENEIRVFNPSELASPSKWFTSMMVLRSSGQLMEFTFTHGAGYKFELAKASVYATELGKSRAGVDQ